MDDESSEPAHLGAGEVRVLVSGSGVKRSEGSKSKWRPRYFCLVEVGAVNESDPPRLEFRWGVDKSALVKGGCKVVALSELVSVECGVTSDDVNKKVKWPYPYSADLSTCFALRTAKRWYHWAAFPAGMATVVRAKLSVELLKQQEPKKDGDRARAATMQSLSEAVRTAAGRDVVLKTRGWREAVAAASTDSAPGMDEVTKQLMTSLKAKRALLEAAGISSDIADMWLKDRGEWSDASELDKTLEELWALEASKAVPEAPALPSPGDTPRTGWIEVRCFVSSTFADMHAEREVLVRKVFPRLRAWAEPRRIRIVECDLRWGVPKGSKNETIFRTCLEEVDRCVLANTHCFFLNMLSERYGWAPMGLDVPDSVIKDFGWIPFASVTTMEILHAAFRSRNPNALFMFRNESFASDLKEEHRAAFTAQDELASIALPKQKAKIRSHFPPAQVGEYTCTVAGYDNSTGVEKVVLGGLEDGFAERVYDFFVEAIARQYGDQVPPPLTATDRLTVPHRERAAALTDACIGRTAEVQSVVQSALDDTAKHGGQVEVRGVPGIGASTVVAAAAAALANMPDTVASVMYHSMQLGESTGIDGEEEGFATEKAHLFRRMRAEFSDAADDGDQPPSIESARQAVQAAAAACAPRKIVLVADGGSALDVARDPSWELPDNVVWVVCAHDDEVREKKIESGGDDEPPSRSPPARIVIGDLSPADRREVATGLLGRYNKTMDASQLDVLVSKGSAGSPSWLTLACEELRVFGVFETVSQKIAGLADSFEGLLEQVLVRVLEEDSEHGTVRMLLGCIALSVRGLSETELRRILARSLAASGPVSVEDTDDAAAVVREGASSAAGGNDDAEGELPYLDWAVAVARARPLLWSISGLMVLRSPAVQSVVSAKLFGESNGAFTREPGSLAHECYRRLIDFFMGMDLTGLDMDETSRVANELLNAGTAIVDIPTLQHIRATKTLFKALPLGYARVSLCNRLRCHGVVLPPLAQRGPPKPGVARVEAPGYCQRCTWSRDMSRVWPNDQSCFMCGNHVPKASMGGHVDPKARTPAVFCVKHKMEATSRGPRCCACGNVGTLAVAAALCRHCAMATGMKCCHVG